MRSGGEIRNTDTSFAGIGFPGLPILAPHRTKLSLHLHGLPVRRVQLDNLQHGVHRVGSGHIRRRRPMRAGYPGVLAGSLLLLPLLSFRTLVAQTQSTQRNAVDGIVVDKGRAPVPSAELELKRQGEQSRVARSGDDGRFSFPNVQTGSVALTVRRMGYTARTITIDVSPAGVAAPVEVELEEIPSDIASVIVESSKQHLEEFYQRKATNSFGKFF